MPSVGAAGIGTWNSTGPGGMPSGPRSARYWSTTCTASAGGRHAPVGEQTVQPLAAVVRGEPDAERRAGVGGEQPALDEALQIQGDVEARPRECGRRRRPILPTTSRTPEGRRMSRRQRRVSTGTTVSRSGWSFRRAYSRASTIQARWTPGRARRSARATGSAWMTSPSEESLTMAIRSVLFHAAGSEAGQDGGDHVFVECVFGSPAMAIRPPSASTVPRSGTFCSV